VEILEIIRSVADACEALELPYYITGSVASSAHGKYRTTEDVDFVVDLPPWKVKEFCARFPAPSWYVDEFVAAEAVQRSGMFNVLHTPTGMKADIIAMKDAPYHELRMSRARALRAYGDKPIRFSTAEDVVLSKLEFYRDGRSDKHIRDITGMYEMYGEQWDLFYLEMRALRIGVQHEWRMIKTRLGIVYPPPDAGT
jgi:hypothetical protein